MAEDFVSCGESSGYREAAAADWDERMRDFYLSIEPEVLAWQEEMAETLERAQDALED
ncbi:hypothetical protein GCM10029992_19800 [Glycomyces albus]